MDRFRAAGRAIVRLAVAGALAMVCLLPASPPAAGAGLVDAVLAEVESHVITASDVALARALGLFGLAPSEAPIGPADIEHVVRARLLLGEASRLGMQSEAAGIDTAWAAATTRTGGPARLGEWLERTGVDPGWARHLVAEDLAWRSYVDARFRAFVFVPEQDVTAALGPGPHQPAARDRARLALRERETGRRLAEWLREARARVLVRVLLEPGTTLPCPLPMP